MRYRIRKGSPEGNKAVQQTVAGLNPNRDWGVEIKQWRDKRTSGQVAYFWAGIVNTVVQETGNDKDTVHDFLCGGYFGETETVVFGRRRKKPVQTLTSPEPLSVEQMTNFLEWSIARMAQEGIIIEPPTEVTV
jgi:hypothetical protein